jgi:pimeloyl-ACP methyl ester carboxylesterase
VVQVTGRHRSAGQHVNMTKHKTLCLAVCLLSAAGPLPAKAQPFRPLIPPVDAPIDRRFEAPRSDYGRGHRGIDYGVPAGTDVRAAAAGRVTFAGRVAGNRAVTIDHGGGLETTYSILGGINVVVGRQVDQGRWIGQVGEEHTGAESGLHFGVKLHGDYVDPENFLASMDVGRAIHLAPLVETYREEWPDVASKTRETEFLKDCTVHAPPRQRPPAPNDNVAIAIAGINTQTRSGRGPVIYDDWLTRNLGYRPNRTYEFSYRGIGGPGLHRRYDYEDTYGDLVEAAGRLRDLVVEVSRRHPKRGVDLMAHSQGGIVARIFLERFSDSSNSALPRIEHLVTFATPHDGAPLADAPRSLDDHTLTGRWLNDALSYMSREGWFPLGWPPVVIPVQIPDPRADAISHCVAIRP